MSDDVARARGRVPSRPREIVAAARRAPRATEAVVALALALAVARGACAGPAEDYDKGLAAFQSDDVVAAMQWLRRAAGENYAPAQALLARILDLAEENEQALELYRRAAEQGNADGMYGLGHLYANGDGVAQDNEQAVHWYTRAAEAGHDHAMLTLAEAYLNGALGLRADRDKARAWLERGAARGYQPARDRLSRMTAPP